MTCIDLWSRTKCLLTGYMHKHIFQTTASMRFHVYIHLKFIVFLLFGRLAYLFIRSCTLRYERLCSIMMRNDKNGESFHVQDERSRFELQFEPTRYLLSSTDHRDISQLKAVEVWRLPSARLIHSNTIRGLRFSAMCCA